MFPHVVKRGDRFVIRRLEILVWTYWRAEWSCWTILPGLATTYPSREAAKEAWDMAKIAAAIKRAQRREKFVGWL